MSWISLGKFYERLEKNFHVTASGSKYNTSVWLLVLFKILFWNYLFLHFRWRSADRFWFTLGSLSNKRGWQAKTLFTVFNFEYNRTPWFVGNFVRSLAIYVEGWEAWICYFNFTSFSFCFLALFCFHFQVFIEF